MPSDTAYNKSGVTWLPYILNQKKSALSLYLSLLLYRNQKYKALITEDFTTPYLHHILSQIVLMKNSKFHICKVFEFWIYIELRCSYIDFLVFLFLVKYNEIWIWYRFSCILNSALNKYLPVTIVTCWILYVEGDQS